MYTAFDYGLFIYDRNATHWGLLTFRHRASSILGQAGVSPLSRERFLYIYSTNIFHYLIFAWPCIIDINNIDNQLDATITAY